MRTKIHATVALVCALWGCSPNDPELPIGQSSQELSTSTRARVAQYFAQRQWSSAINTCAAALLFSPNDCEARYCVLLGRSMVFVDSLNNYLLPRFRAGSSATLFDLLQLLIIDRQLADMATAADSATARQCQYDLPLLPLRIGDAADPIVLGEVRGRHTVRGAYLLGAIANAWRYTLSTLWSSPAVPAPPPGQSVYGLPDLLERTRAGLAAQDALLFAQPVFTPSTPGGACTPSLLQGGWCDKDRNGVTSGGDELLIDIFRPGTNQRIFDFASARFVRRDAMQVGRLTKPQLPAPRCGYQRWHTDTLFDFGQGAGTTDGMSFLSDGRITLPLLVDGKYQIHLMNADGTGRVCLTCTPSSGNNDGVRWRPNSTDTFIFVSTRDHPYATGGAGGGTGQELYAMRLNNPTPPTRLTVSDAWATNYHVNWSKDGQKIVWGRTQDRTWDIWIADFDEVAFRLTNQRRLTPRDTTWWEPHGFTYDGQAVVVSNSRGGLLASDVYALSIADGSLIRLTPDVNWDGKSFQTWNEHAHLSWDGNKLLWMSGRSRPAGMLRLNDGALSPIFDFFWIAPGVFFEFINHPAGYATDLYLKDPYADPGSPAAIPLPLSNDGLITADSMWSPDHTKIIFRQTNPAAFGSARIRILSFDDCLPALR